MKGPFTIFLLFIFIKNTFAQIDLQCNGRDLHSIYLVNSTGFYRMDSVDTNPGNPILLATNLTGAGGISINNNLDSVSGAVTMYMTDANSLYHFWNGTGWTNTGHSTGNYDARNPGGTSNYIFNIDDNGNILYRYDGTGNGTPLISNLGLGPNTYIHDVTGDSQGNFYLFYTNAQKIIAYNPNGIPIDSFITTGFPTGGNCGLAILGNRFYAHKCNGGAALYEGIRTGSTFNFTLIKTFPAGFADIAACPNAATPLAVFKNPDAPHFVMYPNPTRNVAIIKLLNTSSLEIYDVMGVKKTIAATQGLTEYHLDVSKWDTGVYFINALSKNKISVQGKLMVQ